MNTTDAFSELIRLGRPVVQTREAAARLGVSAARASQIMRSLEGSGLVRRLRRGLWALDTDLDPFVVAPYLSAPFPAYISFWSALARHGMIEQVPGQVFVASLARTQRIRTPVATYSIHHIAPELVDGYTGSLQEGYLATPEKALFDTVYLQAAHGGDVFLPEIELPKGFQSRRLDAWRDRVARPRLRTLVSRGLETALSKAGWQG